MENYAELFERNGRESKDLWCGLNIAFWVRIIRHGQQIGCLSLQPSGRGGGLALGAMAIATGVIGDLPMPALRALQDVPTQGRRAAPCQIVKGSPLLGREPLAVPFQELVVTASDHLGHFGLRSDHGLGSSPGGQIEVVEWTASRL